MADDSPATTPTTRRGRMSALLLGQNTVAYLLIGMVLLLGLALLYRPELMDAFNVVLGLIFGIVTTSIPRWLAHRTDRKLRARASAMLVRSDLYAFQDWILDSLEAGTWRPQPVRVATEQHYADLAYEMPSWEDWRSLSQALRFMERMSRRADTAPVSQSKSIARFTFRRINAARVDLAKVDNGPKDIHRRTGDMKKMTAQGATP